MASVGPSNVPPSPIPRYHFDAGLSFPSSRSHHHVDVTPLLMCSGLMVVGHRLDCYSLLSVVFAAFSRSLPVSVLPHRTSSNPFSASRGVLIVRVSPPVVNSFSHRSQCFFIALHCFRVSSSCLPGSLSSRSCATCIKRRQVKSRRYIRIISCILAHPHPHSITPPPPVTSPVAPPSTYHLPVADCLFISLIVNDCCGFSCTGLHHILGGRTSSATLRACNDLRKHYSKHPSFVAASLPSTSHPTTRYLSPLPPRCSPGFPAPPCIHYFHWPSSLLAFSSLVLLVVLLVLFGCFRVPLCSCTRTPTRQGVSYFPSRAFLLVLFVVTLDFLFVWCTLLVLL